MKRIFQIIAIIIIAILLPKENVFAEESGFSVRPILPKDQISKVPYYHIKMEPNNSRTLSVVLKNHQKTPMSVQVDSANGFSNPFGNMNYTKDEETEHSKFLDNDYKMVNIIDHKNKIELKPYEEKVVKFTLNLPNDIKRGQALGGIQFQAFVTQGNEDAGDEDEAAFSVKIKHRYTVGILVELPKKVERELKIKDTTVSSSTEIPQILTEVWNINPIIAKDVVFEYKVFKKGEDEVLFQGKKDLYDFAPVTTMNVPVDWAYENFQPGDYEIEIILRDKKTQKILDETKNKFEVKSDKVVEYAKRTGEGNGIIPNAILFSKWLYVIIIAALGGLFYVGYRLGQRKIDNKDTKREDNE